MCIVQTLVILHAIVDLAPGTVTILHKQNSYLSLEAVDNLTVLGYPCALNLPVFLFFKIFFGTWRETVLLLFTFLPVFRVF